MNYSIFCKIGRPGLVVRGLYLSKHGFVCVSHINVSSGQVVTHYIGVYKIIYIIIVFVAAKTIV